MPEGAVFFRIERRPARDAAKLFTSYDTMRRDVVPFSADNAVFEMHGREEFTAGAVRAGSREHRNALHPTCFHRE